MRTKTPDIEFSKELTFAIENEQNVVFVLYSALEESEDKMKYTLMKILKKYNRGEFFTPLFSCLKELVSNGIKANAKKILILEGAIKNPNDRYEVVTKIKSILNEQSLLEYGIKAKENGLSTRAYFKFSKNSFIIEVVNNVPLSESELKRINGRILISSNYDSLAEFYVDNPDPAAEGMGLGLSMIVVMLKNIGFDWKNFTIATDMKTKTYARVEIPIGR
jgi:hypothetical protein